MEKHLSFRVSRNKDAIIQLQAHPQRLPFTPMINYKPVRLVVIWLCRESGSTLAAALEMFFICKPRTVIIDHKNNRSSGGLPEAALYSLLGILFSDCFISHTLPHVLFLCRP